MTIEAGQPIPKATFQIKTDEGIDAHETSEYFATGRTVMFALPGAFTSTCSAKHLPEFVDRADDLKSAGIDRIACLAVNDAHVMKAWGDQHGTAGKIDMMADPHAEFSRALGIAVQMGAILGERATRCVMIIDDGVLTKMMVEEVGAYEVSSPASVLANDEASLAGKRRCGGARELVAALVHLVACMALDPVPGNVMALHGFIKRLPQILVQHRLLCCRAPAIGLPARHPVGDALHHIFAVGMKIDPHRPFQGIQPLNGGLKLHPVVGRSLDPAAQLAHLVAPLQDRRPSAGTGIVKAGAVRVEGDRILHVRARCHRPPFQIPTGGSAECSNIPSGLSG